MNKAKPTIDMRTRKQHPSRNQAGTALAQEFDEPIDNWGWFQVLRKAESNRFILKNSQLGAIYPE